MKETDEQKEQRELRELEGKNIQHYSALLTAWINTKMEHDKTLITLSAAAIGLLITVLTAKGIEAQWHIFFYFLAFAGYSVSIYTTLRILQKNSLIIESELRKEEGHDHKLERLDRLALWSFIVGTIAFISIGLITAVNKLDVKNKAESISETSKSSLHGLDNFRPMQEPISSAIKH